MIVLLIQILLLPWVFTFAQEKKSNPYAGNDTPDRLVFEGIIGFQFGSITFIEASPIVGYNLTRNFMTGLGFTYQYSEMRNYYLNTQTNETVSRKNNIMGIRIFGRYFIPEISDVLQGRLFLQAEYEYLTYTLGFKLDAGGNFIDPFGYPYAKGNEKIGVNGVLVGGGLNQNLGKKMFANILVLYNLNHTRETPYSNPVIRVGIGAGF